MNILALITCFFIKKINFVIVFYYNGWNTQDMFNIGQYNLVFFLVHFKEAPVYFNGRYNIFNRFSVQSITIRYCYFCGKWTMMETLFSIWTSITVLVFFIIAFLDNFCLFANWFRRLHQNRFPNWYGENKVSL